jgi:hypothetical protein
MTPDKAFDQALRRFDDEYREAEAALRAGGAEAQAVLRARTQEPNGVTRLLARTLLAWSEGRAPDNDEALAGLDEQEKEMLDSPARTPSPSGIAYFLKNRFGASVVDVLALRLLKELDWPRWKILGVLMYLEEHDPATVGTALVRFVTITRDADGRQLALNILGALPAAERAAWVREEEAWAASRHDRLPPRLVQLLDPDRA